MKAGIAIDKWKLAIFERHLSQAGYAFKNAGEFRGETYMLHVDTDNGEALGQVLYAASTEAAMTGKPE